MKNTKNQRRIQELLKDRRDYRQMLIHKRNETDEKIKAVEEQIARLKGSE